VSDWRLKLPSPPIPGTITAITKHGEEICKILTEEYCGYTPIRKGKLKRVGDIDIDWLLTYVQNRVREAVPMAAKVDIVTSYDADSAGKITKINFDIREMTIEKETKAVETSGMEEEHPPRKPRKGDHVRLLPASSFKDSFLGDSDFSRAIGNGELKKDKSYEVLSVGENLRQKRYLYVENDHGKRSQYPAEWFYVYHIEPEPEESDFMKELKAL